MHINRLLRRAARIAPRGIAIDGEDRIRTWPQVYERASRLAGAYRAEGLGAGDRIAILAHNCGRYLEAIFSVSLLGGVLVPLNTRLSQGELAHCAGHAAVGALLVDAEHLDRGRQLCREVGGAVRLIVIGSRPAAAELSFEDLAQAPALPETQAERSDDLAGIFYTGGTTGTPKGAMLTHGNLVANALNLQPHFRFSPETRCLHAAAMFHIAESLSIFGVTMAGGQHLFIPKFDPLGFMEAVEQRQATFSGLVPTMLKRIVDHERFGEHDLSSLQALFYGGSPILESDMRRAAAALPHVALHQGYGLTETSPTITILGPEHHPRGDTGGGKAASAGQQVFGVDVSIRDDDGGELAAGRDGEIWVRGSTVSSGYWRDPAATGAAFRDGWFRTGDVGHFDEDGFLYVVDRVKDMIISGGENVYSIEVENVIAAHPDVLECAVIGVPDPDWGERVHAVIRLRRGADVAGLREHCRGRLAPYKCPKTMDFVVDPLPLSAVGKISKQELKARLSRQTKQEEGSTA